MLFQEVPLEIRSLILHFVSKRWFYLKCVCHNWYAIMKNSPLWNNFDRDDCLEYLVHEGELNVIKWCWDMGTWVECIATNAAYDGQLEILKWYYKYSGCGEDIDWDDILHEAATNGQLEILKWVCPNGILIAGGSKTMELIIKHGHLHILQWLYVMEVVPDSRWYNEANSVEMFKFLYNEFKLSFPRHFTCANINCIKQTQNLLACVKYIRSLGLPFGDRFYSLVIQSGKVSVLHWVWRQPNRPIWTAEDTDYAIRLNRTGMLKLVNMG